MHHQVSSATNWWKYQIRLHLMKDIEMNTVNESLDDKEGYEWAMDHLEQKIVHTRSKRVCGKVWPSLFSTHGLCPPRVPIYWNSRQSFFFHLFFALYEAINFLISMLSLVLALHFYVWQKAPLSRQVLINSSAEVQIREDSKITNVNKPRIRFADFDDLEGWPSQSQAE